MNSVAGLSLSRARDLSICCSIADGRIAEVRLQGGATPAVDKLVRGKTPEQAIRLFGLMYALCGHAHQRAAVCAFEQALQVESIPVIQQLRAVLGSVEIIKEHGLNLLLRVPSEAMAPALPQALLAAAKAFDEAVDAATLYAFPCRTPGFDTAVYEQALSCLAQSLHILLGDFFSADDPSLADINAWQRDGDCVAARYLQQCAQAEWAGFGRSDTLHLPMYVADELESVLSGPDAEAFVAAPHWRGSPCETNAYTRQADHPLIRQAVAEYGNGLYARSLARLLEMRLLYATLPQDLPFCSVCSKREAAVVSGAALVQVEASRGRLLHRVAVHDGAIAAYRIVAPTQWNFHPQGVLSSALTGVEVRDGKLMKSRIEAWVATLDPCVAFNVVLDDAI